MSDFSKIFSVFLNMISFWGDFFLFVKLVHSMVTYIFSV